MPRSSPSWTLQSEFDLIASGGTIPEILRGWPDLCAEVIEQALRFAAEYVENDALVAVALLPA